MKTRSLIALASIAAALALAGWAGTQPSPWKVVAAYRTSLAGRSSAQAYNARLAVKAIDGKILQPGAEFSFNRVVGSWSADRGYVKAPVSYDGELIPSWGGGVCQLSTTLYNAALLSGMEITERHRHQFPAKYAPPGQDAAVAQQDIDLRFRNPYNWPVRIETDVQEDWIICRFVSQKPLGREIEVQREIRQITPPGEVVRARLSEPGSGTRWRIVNHGAPGLRVAVYRTTTKDGHTERELVSEDTYPPINRLIQAEGIGAK
ncbi:MAG: VanW family protein [Armatimonadota bacterium]|nr:VanW family protein [Armatimonadota bacterium]